MFFLFLLFYLISLGIISGGQGIINECHIKGIHFTPSILVSGNIEGNIFYSFSYLFYLLWFIDSNFVSGFALVGKYNISHSTIADVFSMLIIIK